MSPEVGGAREWGTPPGEVGPAGAKQPVSGSGKAVGGDPGPEPERQGFPGRTLHAQVALCAPYAHSTLQSWKDLHISQGFLEKQKQ